jgi:hypothetical protein
MRKNSVRTGQIPVWMGIGGTEKGTGGQVTYLLSFSSFKKCQNYLTGKILFLTAKKIILTGKVSLPYWKNRFDTEI